MDRGNVRRYHIAVMRLVITAVFVISVISYVPNCFGQDKSSATPSDPRGPSYVGDQLCSSCHREQGEPYARTAHHRTSSLPAHESILGSFQKPANTLITQTPSPAIGDPGLTYEMEAKDGRFFETAIIGFAGHLQSRSESMDIVTGSGVRGQTYLYWKGDVLFELPVSYWSDGHQWINSPGYRNGPPNFARAVIPRCLECHASYIKTLSPDPATNLYEKTTFVPGIQCETCHGPGAAHVALEQNRSSKQRKPSGFAILNPAEFSRERQMDLCAYCHSGAQQVPLAPAFSYVPGALLEKYLQPVAVAEDARTDVHGNQVGLLKRSRCFLASGKMTCSTCHDVHAPERAAASYSIKCLNCHKAESCGMHKTLGAKIISNCIDCHMPLQQTQAIVSQTADRVIRTTMRTHWIRVYSELKDAPQ